MKAGLVPSVPEETIVVIRKSYLIICDENACAAALLNYLEYCLVWKRQTKPQATIRNQMAIARGQQPTQDTDEWWYASFEEIAKELLSIWGRNIVIGAMGVLLDKKFITRRHNPVKGFDRTWQYHFEAENVRKAMEGHHLLLNDASFNSGQCIIPDETMQNTNVNDASFNSGRAIPEITIDNTEITNKENSEAIADASTQTSSSSPEEEEETKKKPRKRVPRNRKQEPIVLEEEVRGRVEKFFGYVDTLGQQVTHDSEFHFAQDNAAIQAVVDILPLKPTESKIKQLFLSMWNAPRSQNGFLWQEHMDIPNICKEFKRKNIQLSVQSAPTGTNGTNEPAAAPTSYALKYREKAARFEHKEAK